MAKDRLREAFLFVRKTFFPRWDKKNQWVVKELDSLPSQGKCDLDKKAILVRSVPEKDHELYWLLIHEICHTVASPGHAKKWCNRMGKAADTAQELGYTELSKMLNAEVEEIKQGLPVRAADIYNLVAEWALDAPDLTYDKMLKAVSRQYGFYPEDLEKAFKRFRQVYENAIRESRDIHKAQQLFEQKHKLNNH